MGKKDAYSRCFFYEKEGVAADDEEEQDPLERFTVKRKSNFIPQR